MKQALIILTLWVCSSQESYSQGNKMDMSPLKDATLVSTNQPEAPFDMTGVMHASQYGYLAKTETAVAAMPSAALAKQLPMEVQANTQALLANAQALHAYTKELEANTRELRINTEALRENMQFAEANKRPKIAEAQLVTIWAKAPPKTQNNIIKEPVKPIIPAKAAAKTPVIVANTIIKPSVKNRVSPVKAPAKVQMPAGNTMAKVSERKSIPVSPMPVKLAAKAPVMAANIIKKPQVKNAVTPAKAPAKVQMAKISEIKNIYERPVPVKLAAKAPALASKTAIKNAIPTITPVKTANKPKMPVASISRKPTAKPAIPAAAAPTYVVPQLQFPSANTCIIPVNLGSRVITPVKTHTKAAHHLNLQANTTAKQVPLAIVPVKSMVKTNKPMNKMAQNVAPQAKTPAKATLHLQALPKYRLPAITAAGKSIVAKSNRKVSLNYLLAFPLLDKTYDSKMRGMKHIPADVYSGCKEGDIITTRGYVHLVVYEGAGKNNETYHVQLTANQCSMDSCLNLRITSDQLASVAIKELTENAKKFIRERLLKGNEPGRRGNVMDKPVFVSITGKLSYNSANAMAMRGRKPVYAGIKGVHSYTPWEICQVSHIEFSKP